MKNGIPPKHSGYHLGEDFVSRMFLFDMYHFMLQNLASQIGMNENGIFPKQILEERKRRFGKVGLVKGNAFEMFLRKFLFQLLNFENSVE